MELLNKKNLVRAKLGVFQRLQTLMLLQKHRDTNGRRIVIQIGGVYTTFSREGILLQEHRGRNGCIAILFYSIRVRGRCDFPDLQNCSYCSFQNFHSLTSKGNHDSLLSPCITWKYQQTLGVEVESGSYKPFMGNVSETPPLQLV